MHTFSFSFVMRSSLLVLLVAMLAIPRLSAQQHELGAGLLATSYQGDIAPTPNGANIRPMGTLFYRYNFSAATSLRFGVSFGQFAGDDADYEAPDQTQRGYSFAHNFAAAELRLEYNFLDFRSNDYIGKTLSPFVYLGVGTQTSIISIDAADNVPTESFPGPTLLIPAGFGLKYALTDRLNLTLELGGYFSFSDKLDGLVYEEDSPRFARGNPANFDHFYTVGVTVSYRFLPVKCPTGSTIRNIYN